MQESAFFSVSWKMLLGSRCHFCVFLPRVAVSERYWKPVSHTDSIRTLGVPFALCPLALMLHSDDFSFLSEISLLNNSVGI